MELRPFFGRKSTPLKYKYLIFILLQNQVWHRPATFLCSYLFGLSREGTDFFLNYINRPFFTPFVQIFLDGKNNDVICHRFSMALYFHD